MDTYNLNDSLEYLANETGKHILAWRISDAPHGAIEMFDDFEEAYEACMTKPVAAECAYKFITSPQD